MKLGLLVPDAPALIAEAACEPLGASMMERARRFATNDDALRGAAVSGSGSVATCLSGRACSSGIFHTETCASSEAVAKRSFVGWKKNPLF